MSLHSLFLKDNLNVMYLNLPSHLTPGAIRLTSVAVGFYCLKYGHWYFCECSDGGGALSFGCLLRTLTAHLESLLRNSYRRESSRVSV